MRQISRLLAIRAGLSEQEAELIKLAAPLHDVGKIAIPDKILNKPGKHDPEEWNIMQEHAQIGSDILSKSDRRILQLAAIIAAQHHERWDGSGYPRGLQGEQIHIAGRIAAIADVFDALGSQRCYKDPWPDDQIIYLIQSESGKQFDPRLVELVMENLEDILAIRAEFPD